MGNRWRKTVRLGKQGNQNTRFYPNNRANENGVDNQHRHNPHGILLQWRRRKNSTQPSKRTLEKRTPSKVYAPIVSEDCFPELAKDVELVKISNNVPESAPLKTALKMIDSSIQPPTKEFKEDEIIIAHGQPSNWIAYRVSKKTGKPYVSYLHQANRFCILEK